MPVKHYSQEHNYDKAVIDWVHSAQYNKRPLPCCFASPERAFAQMQRLLEERRVGAKTIPLPFASVHRIADMYDPLRFNNTYQERVAANADFTTWYGMERPLPFTFTYQIDLWARLIHDLNDLTTQFLLRHRADELYLTVDHPVIPTPDLKDGPRRLIVLTLYRGANESSEVEPGTDQRVIRKSLTYDVFGWRCFEPDEIPSVITVITDIVESDDLVTDGDLLSRTTVTGYLDTD